MKPGQRAAVLNAPPSYQPVVGQIPDVHQQLDGTYDFLHVFVWNRSDVLENGPRWRAALAPNGVFWASYPKGKSIPTDLNRDSLRRALQEVGLETVSQVSIDDVWSALRAKLI